MKAKLPGLFLILFLAASLLSWGGVHPLFEAYFLHLTLGLFALTALCHIHRKELIGLSVTWMIPLTLFFMFQMIPLPSFILQLLSPESAHQSFAYLGAVGLKPAWAYPISIDPAATFISFQAWLCFCLIYLSFLLAFQDSLVRKWILPCFVLLSTLLALLGNL